MALPCMLVSALNDYNSLIAHLLPVCLHCYLSDVAFAGSPGVHFEASSSQGQCGCAGQEPPYARDTLA